MSPSSAPRPRGTSADTRGFAAGGRPVRASTPRRPREAATRRPRRRRGSASGSRPGSCSPPSEPQRASSTLSQHLLDLARVLDRVEDRLDQLVLELCRSGFARGAPDVPAGPGRRSSRRPAARLVGLMPWAAAMRSSIASFVSAYWMKLCTVRTMVAPFPTTSRDAAQCMCRARASKSSSWRASASAVGQLSVGGTVQFHGCSCPKTQPQSCDSRSRLIVAMGMHWL